jgi:hypothetical protein
MQLITQRIPGIQRLRIDSKRLKSGKCQVKYEAEIAGQRHRYGYVLADPKQTMEETVHKIVKLLDAKDDHLYSVRRRKQEVSLDFRY